MYLLVPWKGSNDADAAGAPKERPTGNGRFKLSAFPPPGASNIPPEATIKVDAQNGRIKRLSVKAPDGTPVHGYLDRNGEWWLTTTNLSPGTAYNVTALVVPNRGKPHTKKWTFTTVTPTASLGARSFPVTTRSSASVSRSRSASPRRS